jgi:tetratricopeptide (TPR) repeat protein/sugar lactone lactonase YvrE
LAGGYSRDIPPALRIFTLLLAASTSAVAQPADVQFLRGWQGSEPKVFSAISGFALAGDGAALIADRERGVVWRVTAEASTALPAAGQGRAFDDPKLGGVAALPGGRLALVSTRRDAVALLSAKGEASLVFGGHGGGAGALTDPEGIAYSSAGRLYVADRGNRRISVYSGTGVPLHVLGPGPDGEPGLDAPTQVSVDGEERVYVLESVGLSGRVSVLDRGGKLLKRLSGESVPTGPNARWSAIAVDGDGRLYVADATSNNVSEIDWQAGQVRRRFGGPGSGRGQFKDVQRLAVQGDTLAVVDAGNRKIEFYKVAGASTKAQAALRLPGVRRAAEIPAACDRVHAFRKGELLCLDAKGGKVLRLDAEGKVLGPFAADLKRPRRAAVDARDVAIADGDRIKVFTLEGAPRFAMGGGGSLDGEFDDIGGMHLADYLYVADTGNRRVQIFTRDGILVHKLADAGAGAGHVGKPAAVVTDRARNLYVADVESFQVQVFNASREWQYALGGAASGYKWIHALAIDGDDRLYVLAATEGSRQVVDVYRGREHEFRFSALRVPGVEASGKAALSLPVDGYDLVLHDAERGRIARYQVLLTPEAVAGLEVRGEPARAQLRWRKSAEGFVTAYRVYGAAGPHGPWERVLDTREPEATLKAAAATRYAAYEVSAVSSHGVESARSAPVEDLFRAGYREYESGRHEAALPLFERAAKADPGDAAPIEYLGRSQLALGRHAAALAQFRELAKRPGHEAAGRRLEAQALLAAGDRLGARAAAERAIAANQADAATYALCARLSLELNDAMGAVRCVEAALAKDPGNARSRAMLGEAQVRLGAVDKGLAELAAATAASPTDAEPWRRAAAVLQGLGRPREALEHQNSVLRIVPGDPEARLASAQLHLELGELDQARSIALSMAGSPAQEARGQVVLGRIALKLRKPEEALLALARATQLDPAYGDAWGGLAEAYLALNDEAKAADALQKAARLPGAGVGVYRQLAELETRAGHPAAALAALERAVSIAPADASLRLAQARALASLERWPECLVAAREAQRLAPKNVEALTLAAEAAARQGRSGEAIETLKKAALLAPDAYEVQLALGRSYADNHLYQDARTHLERAAQLDRSRDAPQVLLGRTLLEQRDYDAAITAFTAAVTLNASEANRRELDAAYERKKRAQQGGGARFALENLRLNRVFVAAHKQYATDPLGRVTLRNDSAEDFKGLKLSFFVKEYMDFPVSWPVPLLKARSSIEMPLTATFNAKVLGIDEDTQVLVVVTLAMADPRDGQQEITQATTLYGKNAIVWSSDDMVGSFVTPRDDTLRNFVRETVNRYGPPPQGVLNRPLAQAAALYNTLSGLGLRYQPDPNSPYSKLSADQVDYVQFPRETLRLKSGDCDDLSVLLAASFENLGIETALLETPGHLLLMFRTGLAERDRGLISLQDDLLALRGGEVWIPVESTLIATSFTEAWAEGAKRYREAAAAGQLQVLSLRKAWERFPPATLSPVSWSVEVPGGERVARLVEREQSILLGRRLEREVLSYRQALAANPRDIDARLQIGGIYARNGVYDVAMREFDAILAHEPRHGAALNNRGNVYFARGEFERALESYLLAEQVDPKDGGVRMNCALAYYRLGKLSEARDKFREAEKLDTALAGQFGGLAKLLGN